MRIKTIIASTVTVSTLLLSSVALADNCDGKMLKFVNQSDKKIQVEIKPKVGSASPQGYYDLEPGNSYASIIDAEDAPEAANGFVESKVIGEENISFGGVESSAYRFLSKPFGWCSNAIEGGTYQLSESIELIISPIDIEREGDDLEFLYRSTD